MASNDKNAGHDPRTERASHCATPAALERRASRCRTRPWSAAPWPISPNGRSGIVGEWLKRQAKEEHAADPLNIGSAFMEMTARLMANPARLMQAQFGFWQDYMSLWQNTTRRMMGIETEPVIDPRPATGASRTMPGRTTRSSTSSSSPTCCPPALCRTW